MVRSFQMRFVMWLLASSGICACSDSTPIGTIECIGERTRCGFTEEQRFTDAGTEPPRDEIASTGLDVLMPVWSGNPFEDVGDSPFVLLADANRDLWSARGSEGRVVLSQLDREGVVREEHTIDPPKGSRDPGQLRANLSFVSAGSASSIAVIEVYWNRGCDGSASDPQDCWLDELILFEDLAGTPRRIDVDFTALRAQANRSGVWLLYDGAPHIDKLDASGKLVWRQTGLPLLETSLSGGPLGRPIAGALRSDNRLNVLLWGVSGGELWKLDAQGSIETRQPIALYGDPPRYAIDARGRDVIAGGNPEGDLILMRVLPDGTAEGNVVTREEYLTLRPDGFALDDAGAVYVTTEAGGREPEQRRELLCQLPATGSTRCFTLGEISVTAPRPLIDQLVVPEPGVAYVRSGSALRRYELPAQ